MGIILNDYGRMTVEGCRQGFDEETKQKTKDYI